LFYVAPDGKLMTVEVEGAIVRQPVPLFPIRPKADRGYPYDVTPDGRRILVNTSGEGNIASAVTLIDWRATVQR
jgi:hypothetical protein